MNGVLPMAVGVKAIRQWRQWRQGRQWRQWQCTPLDRCLNCEPKAMYNWRYVQTWCTLPVSSSPHECVPHGPHSATTSAASSLLGIKHLGLSVLGQGIAASLSASAWYGARRACAVIGLAPLVEQHTITCPVHGQ